MSLTARITALAQAVGADIKTTLAHIGSRGPAHGVATTSEAGFLSASDKTKLDSMSEGASGDANAAVAAHAGAADPHGVTYPITPGGYAVNISGTDLNTAYRTGFFRGYGLAHAPLDNGGWWHVLIASHDANWVKQTATAFGSGNNAGDIYERVCNEGAWTSWAKVYKGTDVYPVAASLGSGAAINGTLFTGLSDIHTAEAVHSARHFAYGTLIETSIDYTGFAGDPFLLRITGNSYGRFIPIDISVQGYIYYSALIHYGGASLGSGISGLVALLHNGHLCFWFPPQGYWEGYDVSVITAYTGQNVNKVVSIQDAVMPVDATRVVELSSHIKQAAYKGDAIDGTPIGQTTPAAGAFTRLDISAGTASAPSLSWYAPCLASLRATGHVQLAIGAEANANLGHPVWLQARHSSIDGESFPLELNPLGGSVTVGPGGFRSDGHSYFQGITAYGSIGTTGNLTASGSIRTDTGLDIYSATGGGWATYVGADGHLRWYRGGDRLVLSEAGLSVAGSGTFGGNVSTANGTLVMRGNSLENHATDALSGVAINYYGYANGFSQYRDLNIYDGKGELFGHFDGPGHGLVLGIGAHLLVPEDRRLRVVGGHYTATMQLYSFGDGGANPASLDFWASEPGQTFKGAGIGSNVNKHPYYGMRNSAAYGGYLRFREDGYISFGTAYPGGSFTDRPVIAPNGVVLAHSGLDIAQSIFFISEFNVRGWELQATGGNLRLTSGDSGGALAAPRLRSETEVRAQQLVIGNLATSTGVNLISNSVFQELAIVLALGEGTAQFLQSAYSSKHNPASSAVLAVGHTSAAGRSIDATGTINASGADYAEHEPNNGHKIIKGQIVGFDADGKLTTQFSDALRFAVKSTEPGYTGGNTWMDSLPPRPNKPVLHDVQRRSYGEADEVNPDAEVDALIEQEYQDALVAAEIEYQSALAQYERDKTEFDQALAEAVSKVDRIAYCGKVPVNYQGADAGQYLIAKAMPDDSIGCYAVYAPTFQEYLHCIGRVNKVLPDGRAEIAVIIH